MVLMGVMELAMRRLKRLQHQCPPVLVMVLILQLTLPRYAECFLCISVCYFSCICVKLHVVLGRILLLSISIAFMVTFCFYC